MNWLKEHNRRTSQFMRGEFHSLLWMCGIAFGILILLGLIVGLICPEFAQSFVGRFTQQVEELGIMNEDGTVNALMLFANNVRAATSTVLYGLIPFIHLPVLALGTNSLLLGAFAAQYIRDGMSMVLYLAALLPHAIFELPAIVIAIALGVYLCALVGESILHDAKGAVWEAWRNISHVMIFRVIPLLLIASLVEAYITPVIAGLV